jgi:hypothetical protein
MKSKPKYLFTYLFFLALISFTIFPQTKIPSENKNWKWLTPVNNKIYSIAIDESSRR